MAREDIKWNKLRIFILWGDLLSAWKHNAEARLSNQSLRAALRGLQFWPENIQLTPHEFETGFAALDLASDKFATKDARGIYVLLFLVRLCSYMLYL